jgi:hypothetical protein
LPQPPDGLDLVPRVVPDGTPDPRVFLVEINPRAPGHRETIAIEYIDGVDYWPLHMLSSAAPDDEETLAIKTVMRSLSYPLAEEIKYPIYVGSFRRSKAGKWCLQTWTVSLRSWPSMSLSRGCMS